VLRAEIVTTFGSENEVLVVTFGFALPLLFQKLSKSKVTEKSFRRQHLDSGMLTGSYIQINDMK
jgi:glycopeptide antibiotics resistance protein